MDLFHLEHVEDLRLLKVSDLIVQGGWDFTPLEDFLPPQAMQLVAQSVSFSLDNDDLVSWKPTPTGQFTIASAYEVLRIHGHKHSMLSLVWISIFSWRLLNSLLPFPEALATLGFYLPSKYCHCDVGDSMDHCFIECSLARPLWLFFLSKFSMLIEFSSGLFGLLHHCWVADFPAPIPGIKLMSLALCWVLWKFRI